MAAAYGAIDNCGSKNSNAERKPENVDDISLVFPTRTKHWLGTSNCALRSPPTLILDYLAQTRTKDHSLEGGFFYLLEKEHPSRLLLETLPDDVEKRL